jgi:hypothetical protein
MRKPCVSHRRGKSFFFPAQRLPTIEMRNAHHRLAPRSSFLFVLSAGLLASLFSLVALIWRGRAETGSALAAVNAPSHWLHGEEALRHDEFAPRYTLLGAATHIASAIFWAMLYRWWRGQRREPTPANAMLDAAALTAAAAVVDLKLVPQRLTPGFETRLQGTSVAFVYVTIAAGLALGGLLARR